MAEKYWIILGDIHMDTAFADSVPDLPGAAGVIVSGDLTNNGNREDAARIVERIRAVNAHVLAQVGNMDTPEVNKWLEDNGLNIHNRLLSLDEGLDLFAVGYSTPTPFGTPLEVEEEVLASWLRQAQDKCRRADRLIFVSHTPPVNTRTDALGNGSHVGSQAVREFIEVVQPEACVTGHIHEAVAEDWVGNCPVINPGMAGSGGYVRVDLTAEGLKASLKGVG
ncbi:MAG: metallophosphoesterase [Desulfonatronovibrionaceae bacterium]